MHTGKKRLNTLPYRTSLSIDLPIFVNIERVRLKLTRAISFLFRDLVNSGGMNAPRTKDELLSRWSSTTINGQNNDTNEPTNGLRTDAWPFVCALFGMCILVRTIAVEKREEEEEEDEKGKEGEREREREKEKQANVRRCTLAQLQLYGVQYERHVQIFVRYSPFFDRPLTCFSFSPCYFCPMLACACELPLSPSLVHHGCIFLVLLTLRIHPDRLTLEKWVWNDQRRNSGHGLQNNVVGSHAFRDCQAYCLARSQRNRERERTTGRSTDHDQRWSHWRWKETKTNVHRASPLTLSLHRVGTQLTESDEKKKHTWPLIDRR